MHCVAAISKILIILIILPGRNTNRGLSEFAPFFLPPNRRKWWFSPRRIRRGKIGGFRRGGIAVQKKITGKYSPLNTIEPVPLLDQSILTKEAYIIILVPLGGYILEKEYYILVPVPREL